MTLADKMARWGELRAGADALEDQIRAEVLALGKTQAVGDVTAKYMKGRTTYDYAAIAGEVGPEHPDFNAVVAKYTEPKVDWKSIVDELGAPPEVRAANSKTGEPSVAVKLGKGE